ncbi:MAG: hypothetical protein DI538_31625 [Azospira oryzae]|nr:MAG: hypothetical protein DI538_31625 [Azospira oryzae]
MIGNGLKIPFGSYGLKHTLNFLVFSQWAALKPDKKQPIQFSNFEMRRSQSKATVIQPAIQRSQPPIALDEQRLPIQDDE